MTAVATRPTTTTTTGIASSVTQHNHPNHLGKVGATHAILGRLPIQQDYTNYTTMDTPGGLRKADDFQGLARHHRASSDPGSRGGAFVGDVVGGHLLDAEPNPFERSFSGTDPNAAAAATAGTSASATRRARSISPNSLVPRATPGGTKLPPLALMNSPGQDLTEFGWGSDSLRTGPLSPALLNGPAGGQPGMYNMRNTGLTPMGGGNNGHGGVSFPPPSPATAALFAMMTNNTPGVSDANAPGMGGGGPRPHEGPNEANNFEASFAQAAHDHHQNQQNVQQGSIPSHLQHQQPHLQQLPHYQSAPALINGMHRQQLASQLGSQAGRSMAPQSMLPDHPGGPQRQLPPQQQGGYYGQQPPQNDPYGQPNTYGHYGNNGQPPQLAQHNSAYAALPSGAPGQTQPSQQPAPPGGNQNPLYLLSQASGHTDDAVVAAAALSGLGGSAFGGSPPGGAPPMQAGLNGMNGGSNNANNAGSSHSSASSTAQNNVPATRSAPKRGAAGGAGKRKKSEMANDQNYGEDVKPPVAKKGKRQSKPTAKAIQGGGLGGGGGSSVGGDDASLDGMPEMSMSPEATGNKPNETEDEKRKNFLERNRQAALKCRQRKKAWLANLQSKVEMLTTDNDTLQQTVTNLKEEIQSLRAILQAHANCPVASTAQAPRNFAQQPAAIGGNVQRY